MFYHPLSGLITHRKCCHICCFLACLPQKVSIISKSNGIAGVSLSGKNVWLVQAELTSGRPSITMLQISPPQSHSEGVFHNTASCFFGKKSA